MKCCVQYSSLHFLSFNVFDLEKKSIMRRQTALPCVFQCSLSFEAKQVNGEHGFRKVLEEARSRPSTLWRGTAGVN